MTKAKATICCLPAVLKVENSRRGVDPIPVYYITLLSALSPSFLSMSVFM